MELRFLRTFIKYHHHVILPNSSDKITKNVQVIAEMLHSVSDIVECQSSLNVESLVSQWLEFIEGNTSSMYIFELDGSYLSEYMGYLGKNLNDALRYLVRSDPFFTNEIKTLQKIDKYLRRLKVIQKKMRFVRYLHGNKLNGYVDLEKLEGLETRIQFMADDVGQFCLAVWINEIDGNDTFRIENKPAYLLCMVVLLELETQKLFLGELKASKVSRPRYFKDQKLRKSFIHHLRGSVVYLRNKKLPPNVFARNIDVEIESLLVVLGNEPNCIINCNSWNEVFETVGA